MPDEKFRSEEEIIESGSKRAVPQEIRKEQLVSKAGESETVTQNLHHEKVARSDESNLEVVRDQSLLSCTAPIRRRFRCRR